MIFHDRTNDHFEISYSILYNGIWNGNIFWVQIVLRSPWRINGAEIKFPQKVKTKQNNRNVMKEIILDPNCHLFECTHVCKSNICTHQPRQTVMCFRMYQRGQGSQDQTFDYENCQNHHPLIEEKTPNFNPPYPPFSIQTYCSVQQKLAMGGGLHFIELWDVVEDGKEDDGQDVHIATADLGTNLLFWDW